MLATTAFKSGPRLATSYAVKRKYAHALMPAVLTADLHTRITYPEWNQPSVRTARTLPLTDSSGSMSREHSLFRSFSSNNQDDEWIPPAHFAHKISNLSNQNTHSELDILSASDIDADEIEVIDVEATFNNPSNKVYLDQFSETNQLTSDETFGIETSDSDFDELLSELKEAGEHEKLKQIVKQFGLEDKLAALERNDDDQKDNDEFDRDFERSLEGLSEDEIIDELIENSPALSQLEMELLSQEMDNGLDLEDDRAVSSNAAYMEFRKMVLEDYNEQKRAKEEAKTNATSASDYSFYPQDWKDYDSTAAFSKDFLDEDDSWIPPVNFIPSNNAKLEKESRLTNEKDMSSGNPAASSGSGELDNTIDWLQARRSRLEGDQKMPSQMLTPAEAESFRHKNSHIPVILHTLFTPTEVSDSLLAQGGTDIKTIDTSDYDGLYSVSLGCDYLMIVTGRNSSHIRVLAESIVRNLKDRKLHERGVVGAMQGPEGGVDIFSNKPSRNRANRNGQTLSAKVDDDWMVVDCGNIHVHILESTTRKCLNIEGLWDLNDPNSEGSKLRRVNFENEDEGMFKYLMSIAVDIFC